MTFARRPAEELLDEDHGSPAEVASALASIGFVNRWLGGERVHLQLLREVAGGRSELDVLEVAAGRATALARAGMTLLRPHRQSRKPGQSVTIRATLLDRRATHLPGGWPSELPSPCMVEGDALRIPLPDRSVDVVSSCLFVHHLSPEQVAVFLRESLRVARVAVIINDLERTPFHYLLARLFALVDPSRISRHDGPVSVRQAYSAAEMRLMLAATGHRATVQRRFLFRLAVTLWVA